MPLFQQHCFWQGSGRERRKQASEGKEYDRGRSKPREVRKEDTADVLGLPNNHAGWPFSSAVFCQNITSDHLSATELRSDSRSGAIERAVCVILGLYHFLKI